MFNTDPLAATDTLTVCVDLKDPYSQLALPGTLSMLERVQHPARWLPYDRHVMTAPASAPAPEDRGVQHRYQRDLYRQRELRFYADALSLPLTRLYENPDTAVFAAALLWLQEQDEPVGGFLQRAFNDYWSGAMPLISVPTIAATLQAAGNGADAWLSQCTEQNQLNAATAATVAAQFASLRSAGLFNSPAYLLQGEVYYGRAHLPLLERLLRP